MDAGVYITENSEIMGYDDLLSYLKWFKILYPDYTDWGFDDITGGIDSFFEEVDYYKMKSCFENLVKSR